VRGVPALVGSNPRFRLYAWARIPLHAIYIVVPFLGIHALGVLGKPDAYLGSLLTFNMLGSLVGFVLAGYSGDRHGGKRSLIIAHAGWLSVAGLTPLASADYHFQALFALLGAALSLSAVGLSTLDLEITRSSGASRFRPCWAYSRCWACSAARSSRPSCASSAPTSGHCAPPRSCSRSSRSRSSSSSKSPARRRSATNRA
jgi:hypothetical protein